MTDTGTLVIAEAGVNHNGDLGLAFQLIDAAADARADIIKFQSFKAGKLVTRSAKKAYYQLENTPGEEAQMQMLRALELSLDDHLKLHSYCQKKGIRFLSTGFDKESLSMLMDIGSEFIKIPSGDITNLPLLEHAASFKKTIILSTGMARMCEIDEALRALYSAGTLREQVYVLHCNTQYPTPIEDVNLAAMDSIGQAFKVKVGYSDHTRGITVPIAAVARGARIIEKHVTLDRGLPGPDHPASLEPNEFADMVAAIRDVEKAIGDGLKQPSESERDNIPVIRKSLVALVDIHKGDIFSPENVGVKRPGEGISPMRWNEVIGRVSAKDFAADDFIEL